MIRFAQRFYEIANLLQILVSADYIGLVMRGVRDFVKLLGLGCCLEKLFPVLEGDYLVRGAMDEKFGDGDFAYFA